MKRKIVLSIKPEYVAKILDGSKKFEYRTRAAKKNVDSIIIYETAPMKKVVAEAEILDVLAMPPEDLWKLTEKESGIRKSFFDSYFKNRKIAYAYKLGKITVFNKPQSLSHFGLLKAPQSFAYVTGR